MKGKYRVIDGFDYKNEHCKLIESIETEERYSTENDLEANSLCELLNEKEDKIRELEKERKFWKYNCISESYRNSILKFELELKLRQGYELSDSFEKYEKSIIENSEWNKKYFDSGGFAEVKCILNKDKICNNCDECILCYNCCFLLEKIDDFEVICDLKGQVDLHSTCHLYKKSEDIK